MHATRPTGRLCGCGGTGRRTGFRFQRRKAWRFKSSHPHQLVRQTSRPPANNEILERDTPMQVTETLNEGLKRKLAVVIPAADLNTRLDARLDELKSTANIKGFRPGKVPMSHLKKVYGKSAMSEVLSDAINTTVGKALDDRSERAAAQ